MMARFAGCLLAVVGLRGATASSPRGAAFANTGALLQTWNAALEGTGSRGAARETPVTRVVGLLKDMSKTLQAEADEDEKLYEKLKCWCESNSWEKGNAVEASKEKVEQLKADIESLTAKEGGLTATIADVKAKTENDKKALADAIAIREKQKEEFHGMEVDSIQALENLKAAITVLAKHQGIDNSHPGQMEGASLPQLSVFSLLGTSARGKKGRWSADRNDQEMERNLDDFMRRNGFYEGRPEPLGQVAAHKFLQQGTDNTDATATTSWSAQDAAVVRKALKSAAVFAQAHHTSFYYPSYSAQSGEIVGILKQLQEEMQADLGEAQKAEAARSEAFEELRSAKTMEIEAGEKMEEQKEDELAKTANELAEAKEDLGQEQAILANNEAFLKNVKVTCADADKNWEERKAARQAEIVAVTETIGILTEDEAKDAAAGTYSLLQRGSARRAAAESSEVQHRRREAARALREVAAKTHSPELSMLANTVELDAFAKVKKAIDDMIVMLKKQTEDEVKKHDWCKAEFKENEMTTLKTDDRKADLEAKIAELASTIKALETDIAKATHDIEEAEVALQSASLARREENLDYQKVVADQTVVIDVLKKAAKRMAKYYENESFLQRRKGTENPAPGSVAPVAQMEYKPSSGAAGVMQMLEKLISEAKELMAESKRSESEAQKAYEQTIRDTNGAVAALQKEVVTKSKAKARATKDKLQTESDLADTVVELEDLSKMKIDLHAECDYMLKNFDTRQDARSQEIEALQQAKQILNGASLS
mmetsp:Transcript_48312/g.138113  ORF Transcript_48312/g.138113 Transcript_48312/m.138113 type:complete len:771 (+) Transcript_48312:61-2373(+)